MKTYSILIIILTLPVVVIGQTSNCPTIQNLPDTIRACKGSVFQLNSSLSSLGGFLPIDTLWSPSMGLSDPKSINPSVTVGTTSSLYTLSVSFISPINLVINGDFNSGNTGFSSSYVIGTGGAWGPCSNAATYGITNNPINLHSLWASFGDHTSGTGQMMCVNGASQSGVNVWCESFTVLPNTVYDFSAWVATTEASSPGILQFSINNQPLGSPYAAPSTNGVWARFHNLWFSGLATSANICIQNQSTAWSGNDFALDDISFNEMCIAKDSVYLLIASATTTNSVDSFCKDFLFGGQIITAPGNYSHTFQSTGGCDSTVNLTLLLRDSIFSDFSFSMCEDSSFVFGGQLINSAGDYSHSFQTSAGCDSTVYLHVFSNPLPVPNFDFVSVKNEPTIFTNYSSNATTYFWDFGDNTSSTDVNPTHQYTKTGLYTVCLTAWNSEGCRAKICKQLAAEVILAIAVPSAFSPNGDGKNDVLLVRGSGIKEFKLKLYNRWGEMIFETSDMGIGWNGFYKGKKQENETLAYTLEGVYIDGETFQKQGSITVIQ
jgi:gliding motility-associated-like protein